MSEPKTINMVANGRVVAVPEDQVEEAVRQGFDVESSESKADRLTKEYRDETYGGALGKVAAGTAAVARGATLGLSDVALDALGEGEEFGRLREANPTISAVGELAGAVATALPTGGGSLAAMPGAAAARVGARIAKG